MEAVALDRPPIFNGENYLHWKMRIRTYIRSHDLKAWYVLEDGPNVPVKEKNVTQERKKTYRGRM